MGTSNDFEQGAHGRQTLKGGEVPGRQMMRDGVSSRGKSSSEALGQQCA